MLIQLHTENPNIRHLKQIAEILNKNGVIIIPTDTIYAMACKFDNKKAIERLAKLSGKRIEKINFSLLCKDLSHLSEFTSVVNKNVFRLMKNNLPGPFTFILNANKQVTKFFEGNKKTIGIRVPDNKIAQSIIEMIDTPLLVTTIHHDDDIIEYMTDPEEIHDKFEHLVDAVVDGGAGGNIPSTVIDCTNEEPEIIREGKGEIIY
ncbi:MAG: L-threonylcarbamoyladenylate synthase [Bacteroidia bacterium]